jgi:hypothetical protein
MMTGSISKRDRFEVTDQNIHDDGFRLTTIETIKWFCSELQAGEIQPSLEDLFSDSTDCSLLRCSVAACDDVTVRQHGSGGLPADQSFCASETPFVTEYSETECSIAQVSIGVVSADNEKLRVEAELAVRCESGNVWKCLLKAIGTYSGSESAGMEDFSGQRCSEPDSETEEFDADSYVLEPEHMAVELAHSIRNPLGALITAAGLIKSSQADSLSNENSELLAVIEGEALRIDEILTQFLAICRTPETVLESTPLSDIIPANTCDASHAESGSASGSAVRYIGNWDIDLELDATLMASTLRTLTEIVPKRIGADSVSVRCSAGESEVNVGFEYTGEQIRPEMLRKVLLPFNATKDGGSGLSMEAVFAIVNAHRGKLRIAEHQNRCVLMMSLPIAQDEKSIFKI